MFVFDERQKKNLSERQIWFDHISAKTDKKKSSTENCVPLIHKHLNTVHVMHSQVEMQLTVMPVSFSAHI